MELKAVAHRVKGSSSNLGAKRVAEIAREAEYRWTQGDLNEAAELIERLDHAVGEFRRAVEQVRTRGAVE